MKKSILRLWRSNKGTVAGLVVFFVMWIGLTGLICPPTITPMTATVMSHKPAPELDAEEYSTIIASRSIDALKVQVAELTEQLEAKAAPPFLFLHRMLMM